MPGRRCRRGRWACRRAPWRSTPSSASSSRRWRSASAAPAPTSGRKGAGWRAFPWARPGKAVTPYPYILILGQDDNERIMGDKLRELGLSVQWNTELVGLEQQPDSVDGNAQAPRRHEPQDRCRLGRRLRRRPQRGPRALRHRVSRARPTSTCSSSPTSRRRAAWWPDEVNVYLWQEGFHLLFPMRGKDHWRIVGILPPALRGRDDITFEAVIPSLRTRGRRRLVVQGLQLVFHLPHPSPRAPRASATAAASCSATPPTSTARSARRA